MRNQRGLGNRIVVLGLLGCASCVGAIGDPSGSPRGGPSGGPADASGSTDPSGGSPSGLAWPVSHGGSPSALRRLTRDELIATLHVLTGSAPTREDLPAEQRHGHGPLLTSGLSYIATEVSKFGQAMGDFSTRIAPSMLARTGCALAEQAQRDCLLAWSLAFAEQALRRPPRSGEGGLYQKVLGTADGTGEADGIALGSVLNAIFFAPSFVYRTEIGSPLASKPGVRALAAGELASRLSYLATLAPPDPALLGAAAAGLLGDGEARARQFERMSRTEHGRRAIAVFVLEWLGANEPKVNTKSAKYLSGLGADFEQSIRASAEAAVRKVVFESANPTVGGLLVSDLYLGDAAVKAVTQPAGTGPADTGDSSATGRAGLLMHPHVIAGSTKEDGVSPFQIGSFMREALLCEPVSPPPAGATSMAKNDIPPGSSLRESFEYRISAGDICQSCHAQFSPYGYAFLPFDPLGRWLRQDPSGKPWDLSGAPETYGGALTFNSPHELVQQLGNSPQVHGCFAEAALKWALGRRLVEEDDGLVVVLDKVVKQTRGDIAAVFRTIVAAPEFANAVAAR